MSVFGLCFTQSLVEFIRVFDVPISGEFSPECGRSATLSRRKIVRRSEGEKNASSRLPL